MTVLEVNKRSGQFRCAQHGWMPVAKAPVVSDGENTGGLELLKAGVVVKVETQDGRVQKIVVLRRASDDTGGQER